MLGVNASARGAILTLVAILSAAGAPSHGPAKGYLIITGGAPDYQHFLELAGGANARIVVIPTASITGPGTEATMASLCKAPGPFANLHCTVLHTTDRKVADSPEFAAPLKEATGVWLSGGRQWRLADAYLGTLALKEMFNLLDRGGVIAGGSAGASIQASYMVRGSSNPDDNTIMMAPGHETGFGFFTNTAIDQHIDARGRENDLGVVMKAHPELLGIGLDQSASITVHGDVLTANGPERVAIWDGKDHEGKPYYYLRVGDTLNTVTRVAKIVEHPPDPVRKEITLPRETLQQYAGYYRMQPTVLMTITLDGEQLTSQLTGQGKIPIFAESESRFFPKAMQAELEFVKDDNGKVTQLILHQNGADITMPRLPDAEAKPIADAAAAKAAWAAQRYKDQKPQPGSEEALRRVIDELRAGKPNYDQIAPMLAEVMRRQAAQILDGLTKLGAPKSITFTGVAPTGSDIYSVKFENGDMVWQIALAPDGKIESLRLRNL